MTSAETSYLFRHALLRDAAYELQLPADRAKLHGLAFLLIEEAFGGGAPEPPPLDSPEEQKFAPHSTDPVAHELAWHAKLAQAEDAPFVALQCRYLRRAADYAELRFKWRESAAKWQSLSLLFEGANRAEALHRGSSALYHAGQSADAEPLALQSLLIAREGGHRRSEERALSSLGILSNDAGRLDAAEAAYRQALAIHRKEGNRRREGIALGNLAVMYHESGRVEAAEEAYGQALVIHREQGNRGSEGIALSNLAALYYRTARVEAAETAFAQALDILLESGDQRGEGIALGNLANLCYGTGRVEDAEQLYGRALAIHRRVGDRRGEGAALGNLAALYRDTRRFSHAAQAHAQALDIHRETGNRRSEGKLLCNYALFLLAEGREPDARETWRRGAANMRSLQDDPELERKTKDMREACAEAGVPAFDSAEPALGAPATG